MCQSHPTIPQPPQAKLDHKNGTVTFGQETVESQRIAGHLSLMAKRLARAVQMTNPQTAPVNEARRVELVRYAKEVADKENLRRYVLTMC